MKNILVGALLLAPVFVQAQSMEAVRASGADMFMSSPRELISSLQVAPQNSEPVLQPALIPAPFRSSAALGAVLVKFNLAAQLDRNLHVTNYKFGSRPLDLGLATDSGFKKFFFAFTDRTATTLGPIGDLNQLRGNGVNIRIDGSTVYNFVVNINIFNPVRGSTLKMTPVSGTSGPDQSVKTGALLDAVRARAALMNLGGEEYWVFYGRDALPAGGGFANTRSFLFIHMNGLSSKAWPLAEASLKPGAPAVVDLGGAKIAVTLTTAGELQINAAN
ncbi:MAG: hypothetical protein ACHQ51_03995 [Elusimicrobiota bacterium]